MRLFRATQHASTIAQVPLNRRPEKGRTRRYWQIFAMAFSSAEQDGRWKRAMFDGTRKSFATCQPALSINIAACVSSSNWEETVPSSKFIATTGTWVSSRANPVSCAGKAAAKMSLEAAHPPVHSGTALRRAEALLYDPTMVDPSPSRNHVNVYIRPLAARSPSASPGGLACAGRGTAVTPMVRRGPAGPPRS